MQETAEQYIERLISYTGNKDPLRLQRESLTRLAALLRGKSKQQLSRRPAPGKWSAGEIYAHLSDTETVVAWRLRQILASNGVAIQAYDQDLWAEKFRYSKRDAKQSFGTFRGAREGNLVLLKAVSRELWNNYGMHAERGEESITRLIKLTAGHDINHIRQIEACFKAQTKTRAAKRAGKTKRRSAKTKAASV
ncbi:MAG TPA: DinB family protein [Candidatus Limnocylindrales bacterium]|nr:DinB family protein [Candidatus Limnocylindrales bacterium]